MDAPQAYPPYSSQNHLIQSVTSANQLHASVNDASWHPNPPPASASPIFSVGNRPPDLDYPSPAPSTASPPYMHHQHHNHHNHNQSEQYQLHHHPTSLHINPSNNSILPQFNQVESNIGPSRVLTRRQRAALEQGGLGRRASMPSTFRGQDQHPAITPRHNSTSALYPTPSSRPQTPSNAQSNQFQPQHEPVSLNIASAVPLQLQSPGYHPMTPTSMSSPFSPYTVFGHSRSASDAQSSNHRPTSPALSTVSALTSVSSSASGPVTQTFAPYPSVKGAAARSKVKQRKQRLTNVDRREICLHHISFPNARQEDIASKFGVERSTISKILKYKQKWLTMPDHEGNRVSKQRPSKFPEIEEELILWLEDRSRNKASISDNSIREKAKETAKMLHIPEEKFKASSGWIENFKSRHGIRSGVWSGTGRRSQAAPLGENGMESVLSPLNPAFDGRTEAMCDMNDVAVDDDADLESECSPEPEEGGHQVNGHFTAGQHSMGLQSTWPGPDGGASSSQHPADHSPPSTQGVTEQAHHHHPDPTLRLAPLSSQQHVPETNNHQAHMPHFYHPTPPIPDPKIPTLHDAEEAINTLITFLDSSGQGILEDEERQTLTMVKCALFQAASGIPFDRNRR